MLARILTENKNYSDVVELVGKYFSGATTIKTSRLWQGISEHSLIIEIDLSNVNLLDDRAFNHEAGIENLAFAIKKLNKQEAVMVQYLQCKSELV